MVDETCLPLKGVEEMASLGGLLCEGRLGVVQRTMGSRASCLRIKLVVDQQKMVGNFAHWEDGL